MNDQQQKQKTIAEVLEVLEGLLQSFPESKKTLKLIEGLKVLAQPQKEAVPVSTPAPTQAPKPTEAPKPKPTEAPAPTPEPPKTLFEPKGDEKVGLEKQQICIERFVLDSATKSQTGRFRLVSVASTDPHRQDFRVVQSLMEKVIVEVVGGGGSMVRVKYEDGESSLFFSGAVLERIPNP